MANRIGMNNTPATKVATHNRHVVVSIALALAITTFLIYRPTRNYDFLNWDDQSYVVENDYVKSGLTWKGVVWAFTQSHSANWHPLTWLSHALDCQIYGLDAGGHHTTNILLHSLNAALLFLFLRMLTGSLWPSAFIAGIFALHPLRVESVAWVSERKDLLSLFFGILTLMAYAHYAGESKGSNQRSKIWYGATLGLFACGLMSKPMLVTWPFVMLLLDFWPLRRITAASLTTQLSALRGLVMEKIPFFVLTAASCIATVIAQSHAGAMASTGQLPITYRLQNAMVAYTKYIEMLFWPAHLSPIYPHPTHWEIWRVVGSIAILMGITAIIWRNRTRFPYGITGWFWYLGTLVPVIGIVQVGSQAFADRYTYIPQIGLLLLLVWLGAEAANKLQCSKSVLVIIATICLAASAWLTIEQLQVWKNTETLFRYVLKQTPENTQALNGLGSYCIRLGRVAEGKAMLERVIQLEPSFVEAQGALADALESEGRYQEAATHYEEALAKQPDHASLLNNLAWLRAACPDATIRNGNQAVNLALRACELTSYSKPIFIGTLAAALAETGDFQAALAAATQAANLAETLNMTATARQNRELMELYRQGKAAHGNIPNPISRT